MSKKKQPGGNYTVGYGKPPKDTQFKKGHSGNRKGRPKGATNKVTEDGILTHIAREAYREISVNDGTKTLTLPLVIVFIRSLMQKAAKGDLRAINKALELLEKVEEKGASDKAMAASKAKKDYEDYLNTLSIEELDEFGANMKKALSIREISLAAIRQAQRAERLRRDEEVQANIRENLKRTT
jgi:hypothetical protein